MSSSTASSSTSTNSTRGKWSVIGTIVSAPIRGYYYPGRVKAIKKDESKKKSFDIASGSSPSSNQSNGSSVLYSIQFSNPSDSSPLDDDYPGSEQDQGLILDYPGDQLIGRGFEPITRALLSENQKVFITYRNRECSAHVIKHDTDLDDVTLSIDSPPSSSSTPSNIIDSTSIHHKPEIRSVRLNDIRLLPSRKSARIQEHPDYSLLANGRRSPDEISKSGRNGGRQRTSSGSSILATNNNHSSESSLLFNGPSRSTCGFRHVVSSHIDVPQQRLGTSLPGRKRRPMENNVNVNVGSITGGIDGSSEEVMDECAAALVLMSLSASPRSPTLLTERTTPTKLYKCTWPGCERKTFILQEIEQHVRVDHLQKQHDDEEMMSGDEEFYYTEVDDSEGWRYSNSNNPPAFAINHNSSSGPESPISLSEADGASSSSSSSVLMAIGDNSMDSSSNPPSPITTTNNHHHPNHYHDHSFSSAFIPVQDHYRHLEDHEYNRKPDPAGVSILGPGTMVNRRGRKSTNAATVNTATTLISSHPINIPNMENNNSQSPISSSFGGFNSAASSLSSGFGSYTSSLGSSFSPVSPTRSNSGSFTSSSSSSSAGNNKYLRISSGRGSNQNGSASLSSSLTSPSTTTNNNSNNGATLLHRTSPTKRVRSETRKCRKVYGMDKKDYWCTQCKWKKACSRFTD